MSKLPSNPPPNYHRTPSEDRAESHQERPLTPNRRPQTPDALPAYETVRRRSPQHAASPSRHLPAPPSYSSDGVHGNYNMMEGASERLNASGLSGKAKRAAKVEIEFEAGEKARHAAGEPTLASLDDSERQIKADKKEPWGMKRFWYPDGQFIRIPFEPKANMTKKETLALAKLRAEWEERFGRQPFPDNAALVIQMDKDWWG